MPKTTKRTRMQIEFFPPQFAKIKKRSKASGISFSTQVRVLADLGLKMMDQLEGSKE